MILFTSPLQCFAVAMPAIATRAPGECNCKAALLGPRVLLGNHGLILGVLLGQGFQLESLRPA